MEGFLTEEQKKEFLSELRLEKNRKYADRIRTILLLDKGEPISKIAEYFYLTDNSVRNYKNREYRKNKGGFLLNEEVSNGQNSSK